MLAAPNYSGVTTTLYSMLTEINEGSRAIISIENPVEYAIDRIAHIQVGRGEGRSFAENMREAMRQDVDVIALSDIPDKETMELAVSAAMARQLVIACVYADDVAHGLQYLFDLDVSPLKLARVLRLVMSQRIVGKLCPACKRQEKVDAKDLLRVGLQPEEIPQYIFYEAVGCTECQYRGHKGATGIFEIMEVNEPARERLVRKPNLQTLGYHLRRDGVAPMKESALQQAKMGAISVEELIKVMLS